MGPVFKNGSYICASNYKREGTSAVSLQVKLCLFKVAKWDACIRLLFAHQVTYQLIMRFYITKCHPIIMTSLIGTVVFSYHTFLVYVVKKTELGPGTSCMYSTRSS